MADSNAIKLATQVQYLPGVGPARAERFARLGLQTAQQLLFFFPREYEFPAPDAAIDQIKDGVACSLVGNVEEVDF
ncbi:MAG: hypothetical protein ACPHL6_05840, partial [Rubripirellula sp.]